MAHKLKTLAKLYLEGESVEISDIAQRLATDRLKNPNQICSLEFSKSQLAITP